MSPADQPFCAFCNSAAVRHEGWICDSCAGIEGTSDADRSFDRAQPVIGWLAVIGLLVALAVA